MARVRNNCPYLVLPWKCDFLPKKWFLFRQECILNGINTCEYDPTNTPKPDVEIKGQDPESDRLEAAEERFYMERDGLPTADLSHIPMPPVKPPKCDHAWGGWLHLRNVRVHSNNTLYRQEKRICGLCGETERRTVRA